MNNLNRNSRTLIISFVIALMVMVPLRFIEVDQAILAPEVNVLGEETWVGENVSGEVTGEGLEAPYNEIENGQGCLIREVVEVEAKNLTDMITSDLSRDEVDVILEEIQQIEARECK